VGETKGEDDEQEKKVGGRGHGVRQMPVLRNIDFFCGFCSLHAFAARSFIFHLIVPNMSSSTVSSTIHQNVVPSEVGWQFVPQYYTFVNKQPNRLHCFYTKSSTFVHGTEGEECKPCYGQHVRCIPFFSLFAIRPASCFAQRYPQSADQSSSSRKFMKKSPLLVFKTARFSFIP